MPRTVLNPVTLTRDGGTNIGNGATPDATNGNIISGPVGAWHLGILVKNADSSNHSLIVRAAGYSGVPTGAANSGYVTDQYQPFAAAAVGDLTVVVIANTTFVIESLTTDRFSQSDGSLWLDWTASTSMTVYAWQKPYMP